MNWKEFFKPTIGRLILPLLLLLLVLIIGITAVELPFLLVFLVLSLLLPLKLGLAAQSIGMAILAINPYLLFIMTVLILYFLSCAVSYLIHNRSKIKLDKRFFIILTLVLLLIIFILPKEAGLSSGIKEFDYRCKCIGFTYVQRLPFLDPIVYCTGVPFSCGEPERIYSGEVSVAEVVTLDNFGCNVSYEIYDEIDMAYCQQRKEGHCYTTKFSKQDAYNDFIECLCTKMEGSLEYNNTIVNYCEEYFDVRFGSWMDTEVFRDRDEVKNLTGYCKQNIKIICANEDNFFHEVRIQ